LAANPNRLVVTIVRAPLSESLWASSRFASSGLKCTAHLPARMAPKKLTG
jgi:hypothetical protein